MSLINPYGGTFPSKSNPATFYEDADGLFRYLSFSLPDQINALDSSDFFNIQANLTDATKGKVMTVGAFGLGETANAPILPNLNSSGTPSGLYKSLRESTANHVSLPEGVAGSSKENPAYVRVERFSSDRLTQTAWATTAGSTAIFERRYAGSWNAWQIIVGVEGDYAAASHDHDSRYYTETESNSRFVRRGGSSVGSQDLLRVLRPTGVLAGTTYAGSSLEKRSFNPDGSLGETAYSPAGSWSPLVSAGPGHFAIFEKVAD